MICLFINKHSHEAMLIKVNAKGITTHGMPNTSTTWWGHIDSIAKRTNDGWVKDPIPEAITQVIENLPGHHYFDNLKLPLFKYHPELLI